MSPLTGGGAYCVGRTTGHTVFFNMLYNLIAICFWWNTFSI